MSQKTAPHPSQKKVRRSFLIGLLLVVSTLLVYEPVRNFEFIDFDDPDYVTENSHVLSGFELENIKWAFKSLYAANWHPLTWLSHMLDVQLYGLNSGSHHLTSLLFHILNSLLLFIALRKMTAALWKSAFVAALFALHPLHVESVVLVAFRKDVLSGFFFMTTLLCYASYVKHSRSHWYIGTLICFSLGLMAKPMLVTLPFVLLLLDYWPLGRFQQNNARISESHLHKEEVKNALFLVREKIPFFFLTAASCVVTYTAQQTGGAVMSFEVNPFYARVANALVSYAKYLWKTFWPMQLAMFYPHPGTLPLWQSAGALLLLLFITILVLRTCKRQPYLMAGWLWYLGMLVPVIGIVQVGSQAMADRYTYLPLIGVFIMIAWLVPDMSARLRYREKVLVLLSVVLIPIIILTARAQVLVWKDSLTLFEHVLEVTERNFMAHNNIGALLERKGKTDEAARHYRDALRINPYFLNSLINMGNVMASKGKDREALNYYQKALTRSPYSTSANYNLGTLYQRQRRLDKAIHHYRKSLERDPSYVQAHNNIGVVFAMQGRRAAAEVHFREAIRIDPGHTGARHNLAKILGTTDESKPEEQNRFKPSLIQ
ncbi:tetratricopeptide repeat protein [Thermodesulfobacteriota bacterium]